MKVLLANFPWYDEKHPMSWGVRAGSRWPHFQKRPSATQLPRYIPFPFFLAIAANMLKQAGHDILLIDGVAEGIDLETFTNKAASFKPEVIFSETSTPSLNYDINVLKELKQKCSDATIIVGGTHSPESIQAILQEGTLDYWIAGEYETSLTQFINSNCQKEVPGLITSQTQNFTLASNPELDSLPSPLFYQLPVKNYIDPVCGLPAPNAQTWLSRGCPYGCTFCVWPQLIYGKRNYRTRSIDKALDEVDLLINKYGCQSFYFDDDTTNIGENRMIELSEKIIKRGLDKYPWAMMARADCMTEKMLEAFSRAGIYAIKYGVESISPKLINSCNKSTNLPKLQHIIEYTQKLGIKLHLTFTFGLPGETEDTIQETLAYAIATAPESAQFSICTPFPGTEFYAECQANTWLINNDWTSFLGSGEDVVVSTPTLSANQLKTAYKDVQKCWHAFLNERLNKRKHSLITTLKEMLLLSPNKSWFFIGNIAEADFVFRHNELKNSFAEDITANYEKYLQNHKIRDKIIVIISKHDEEKIYQHLKRSFNETFINNKIVRLYN